MWLKPFFPFFKKKGASWTALSRREHFRRRAHKRRADFQRIARRIMIILYTFSDSTTRLRRRSRYNDKWPFRVLCTLYVYNRPRRRRRRGLLILTMLSFCGAAKERKRVKDTRFVYCANGKTSSQYTIIIVIKHVKMRYFRPLFTSHYRVLYCTRDE